MYNYNIKVILFCEIIINLGVLICLDFVDILVHAKLKIKIQRNTIFPLTVAYCA